MLFFYEGYSLTPSIYEIRNRHTNRSYIGQTIHPKDRWTRGHKQSLLRNVHGNQYLQNDFNKCFEQLGHTNFLEFHIIEPLPDSTREKRDKREAYWLKKYKKYTKVYNLTDECNGHGAMSEVTKQKLSKVKKAYYKTSVGQALIQKLAADKKGKSYEEYYGVDKAVEIKQKIRDNKLVEMNRPEVKENLRRLLKGKTEIERYGYQKAEEVKTKKSLSRKGKCAGRDCPKFRVVENIQLVSPSGTIFTRVEGFKNFEKEYGLPQNRLCELLSGKRKKHKGWHLLIKQ